MDYSLAAESRSWWLPSAVAGAIGTVTLGAILVLAFNGQTGNTAPEAPAISVPSDNSVERSCFMQRPQQHEGDFALPQPHCQ
jgi:hypothetical protein